MFLASLIHFNVLKTNSYCAVNTRKAAQMETLVKKKIVLDKNIQPLKKNFAMPITIHHRVHAEKKTVLLASCLFVILSVVVYLNN